MAMDTIVLDLQNQVERLKRELEGWQRLGRVLGDVFRRVGSDRLSAEDAAVRLQAAMEGRLAVTPTADGEQPRDRERDQLIAEAQREVQGGRFDRAIEIYANLHERFPNDTRLLLKLGDCYARSDDVQQALVTYRKVARQYEEQGFFLKAVAVYKQILKLCDTPTEDGRIPKRTVADVRFALAKLYERLGLLVDALLMYEAFLQHAEETDERISTVREAMARLEAGAPASTAQSVEPEPLSRDAIRTYLRYGLVEKATAVFAQRWRNELLTSADLDDALRLAGALRFRLVGCSIQDALTVARFCIARHQWTEGLTVIHVSIVLGHTTEALPVLEQCWELLRESIDRTPPAVLQLLAESFRALEQREKAIAAFEELERYFREQKDATQVARVQLEIAELKQS